MEETTQATTKINGKRETRYAIISEELELDACVASPTQPRKVFDGIEELAKSITDNGQLEPIMVRTDPRTTASKVKKFEIIFGERRVRAMRRAGFKHILAQVRECSDAEVVRLQLIENAHRKDIHPLEEADTYALLVKSHGYTQERIADEVGQPLSHVAQRLRFATLIKPAREAFLSGAINATVALAIARLQPDNQAAAVKMTTAKDFNGEALTTRRSLQVIQDEFLLELADATFDLKAGPSCLTCPKRSKNQSLLFTDEKVKDSCLDPKCFKAKTAAHFETKEAEARANGQTVLKGKAADTALNSHGAGFRNLDEINYDDKKERTYRELVGKREVPVVLARSKDGEAVELVRDADLVKAGVLKAATKHDRSAEEKKAQDKYKRDREKRRELIAVLANGAKEEGTKVEEFELSKAIARGVCRVIANDTAHEVLKRREITPKKRNGVTDKRGTLVDYVDGLTVAGMRGLVVELLAHEEASRKEFTKLLGPA